MDIFGPLPRTKTGKFNILVISDYFTLTNIEASTVAQTFIFQFGCRFGDQGTQFEPDLFKEICKVYGIYKSRTTLYHRQSDGLVERFNRTLKCMLNTCVGKHPRDGNVYLPLLMLAYRSSIHKSTGETPSLLLLGREVVFPPDLLYGRQDTPNTLNDSYKVSITLIYKVLYLRCMSWSKHKC